MARKIFSSCLTILFVPFFLITILFIGAKLSIFNPNFYTKILDKTNFYTEICQSLPGALSQSFTQKDGSTAFAPLTANDLASSLQESISPTWLKDNLQKSIIAIINYGSGKIYSIDIIIPLKDLKNSIIDNLSKKFNTKITGLPVCTDQQLQQLQSQNTNPLSQNCIPSGINIDEIKKQFNDGLTSGKDSLLTVLPDQYNLNDIFNKNPAILMNLKKFFDYSNLLFYILIIVSALLILIIALINIKNISIMLKWISIPLFIAAILFLLSTIFGNLILNSMTSNLALNLPQEIKSLVYSLIGTATNQFFSFYYYFCTILILLSVMLLIVAVIKGKKYPAGNEVEVDKNAK